jgi:integrase
LEKVWKKYGGKMVEKTSKKKSKNAISSKDTKFVNTRVKVKGYRGVYYRFAKNLTGKGKEKVFYVTFQDRKTGRIIEEKVPNGREISDNCSAVKASTYRGNRIQGKLLSPKEKREEIKAETQAKNDKWTIDRLWTEYATHREDNKSFRTDLGRYEHYLKESFGHLEPSEIKPLEVDRIQGRILKKKSKQTCKHVLALLKRIIKFGTDRGVCAPLSFAIKLPKVDNKKTEFLAPDEVQRLLTAIKKDKHPQAGNIMLMALYTGMRRGEILGLQWKDVDLKNNIITLRETKSGKTHNIPINAGAKRVLEGIGQGTGYVFPGNLGNKRSNINRAINSIKTAARLPDDFRPLHGLRHHFASMLASSGKIDLYTLQKLLTHSDHRMTERYAHLHDETLKKAARVASDILDTPDVSIKKKRKQHDKQKKQAWLPGMGKKV